MEVDVKTKEYMRDNARFADVVNMKMYNGKQVVNPDLLKEMDSAEILSIIDDTQSEFVQKYRDILKRCEIKQYKETIIAIIGIENQTGIDYAMPIRNLLYDALQYEHQRLEIAKKHKTRRDLNKKEFISGISKDDKILPVITITLYWGSEEWDGPEKLSEMFTTWDETILKFAGDYSINLIRLNELSENELGLFKTQLVQVAKAIQCSNTKMDLLHLFETDDSYKRLDVETAETINVLTGIGVDMSTSVKGSEVNMCKAMQELLEDSKNEGIIAGKIEGRIEGKIETLVNLVKDNLITLQEAIKRSNISEEEFLKYMR